jgi:16S rRNA (uracil1498-N3)-methyltransferase
MHLFYTPDISGDSYLLSEEESKHCIRVLRLKNGDMIRLMDGKGNFFDSEIVDDHPKKCAVAVRSVLKQPERAWKLEIAIAPTKNNDRLEWFLEKATESGIEKISLIDCDNSERSIVKAERLQKITVSAIKQSMNAFLPEISELSGLEKYLHTIKSSSAAKFIAHCQSKEKLPHLKTLYSKGTDAIVLIGPEGDFSRREVDLAISLGFKECSLGGNRLRTETAALYACIALNVENE